MLLFPFRREHFPHTNSNSHFLPRAVEGWGCNGHVLWLSSPAIPTSALLPSSAIPTSALLLTSLGARDSGRAVGYYRMPRDPQRSPCGVAAPTGQGVLPVPSRAGSHQAAFPGFFTALISPAPRGSLLRGIFDCCQPAHTGNVVPSSPVL